MTEYPDEMMPRRLRPGQMAEVWIAEVGGGSAELVYASEALLLEAPNWAPDGRGLLLNGDGLLWRLDLEPQVDLKTVLIDDLPPINNDHVLDVERGLIYLSANDGHIYVAPIAGGTAKRVTHDSSRFHFLHGVSPDGSTLAFVELLRADMSVPGRLALVSSDGAETRYPEAGSKHLDGPEFARRRLAVFQHRGVRQPPGSRATSSAARRRRPHGTSRGVGDGRLVPTPLAERRACELHQFSTGHTWASARPGRRSAVGSHRRLARLCTALPAVRWAGNHQGQQLVT